MDRRQFLLTTTVSGAAIAGLSACGGGSSEQGAPMADQVTWTISPPPMLVIGSPGIVFDLRASLPAGVRRGGSFQVSSAGAALPPGVVLSSSGVLSVTSAAQAGTTTGIIFSYDEPS